MVVHGRTDEVTHLVTASLGRELEALVGHPILSLSTLPFAVDEAGRAELRCREVGGDAAEENRLGCAAQRVARKFLCPVERQAGRFGSCGPTRPTKTSTPS